MDHLHKPVLLQDIIQLLDIQSNDIVVDGTIGYAGHSDALFSKLSHKGVLIGIDQDPTAITFCKAYFKQHANVHLFHSNFSNMSTCLETLHLEKANKICLDLGMSSVQLDSQSRGFSFQYDAPLDMRMNTSQDITAKDILFTYSDQALSDMFFYYGQLNQNKILVRHIINARKERLDTVFDLVSIIKRSYFFRNQRKKYIKTVSQVFQALRIEVNQELNQLKTVLDHIPSLLASDGRIAIISFHSLEDNIVKRFFKSHKELFKPLNKKVIKATQEEIANNSRSHCALLRVYQRL